MSRNGCGSCGNTTSAGPGGNNFSRPYRAENIRARQSASCGTVTVTDRDGDDDDDDDDGDDDNGDGDGIDTRTLVIGGAVLGAAVLVAGSRGN